MLFDELRRGKAQKSREFGDVAFRDLHFSNAAAFAALAAVDLSFHLLGGLAELTLDEIVRFQIRAEAEVLLALLFAKAADLHQVGDERHVRLYPRYKSTGYNLSVPDRIYFSCWVKDRRTQPVVHQFQKMLETFPFSKLAKRGPVLRIYALEHTEPPATELEFGATPDPGDIANAAREYMAPDCACEIDAAWDLWDFNGGEWKLAPVSVTLACYGPEFDNEVGDQLRIEFGPDGRFLPAAGVEGSLRMGESNLKSLLKLVGDLVGDLERALDVERRQVWSESGANFADVLRNAVGAYHVN